MVNCDTSGLANFFEDEGFLYCDLLGYKKLDDGVIFFLAEEEKIDAFAVECMKYWGEKFHLAFMGIYLIPEENYVVSREYEENNALVTANNVLGVKFKNL